VSSARSRSRGSTRSRRSSGRLQPSGWGTKVKLTVTRELAEQADSAAEAVAPQADFGPEGEAEAASKPALASEVEPQPVEPNPLEPQPVEPQPLEPAAEMRDEAALESAPADELGDDGEPEPEGEDELGAVGTDELDLKAGEEPGEGSSDASAERPSPPEPRRGFFARLFGRRRGTAPAQQPPVEADAGAAPDDSDDGGGEPHDFPQAFTPPEPEPEAREPEPEPLEADGHAEAVGHDVPSELSWTAAGREEDAGAEAAEDADAATNATAEQRAAEDVAAEEVTAVLTGVLDRLGAAHHRPFSRA
jgi:hypothetical protein